MIIKTPLYMGIDPGAKGGLAVVDSAGRIAYASSLNVGRQHGVMLPDAATYYDARMLCKEHLAQVMLEKSHMMMGKKAAFQGGAYLGFFIAATPPNLLKTVTAATWKKHFELTFTKGEKEDMTQHQYTAAAKRRSLEYATDRFGKDAAERHWPRVQDEGIAEAALIALYAVEQAEGRLA